MRPVYLIRSAALACLAIAIPAIAAAGPARTAVPADAVRVTSDAGRVKLYIHIPGVLDRIVWSRDPIEATALADVDNDGDLDLLASSPRHALIVWRNTTDGFVREHAPRGPRRTHHDPGIRAVDSGVNSSQVSDEHRDSVDLTPDPGPLRSLSESPQRRVHEEHPSAALRAPHAGRAPPSLA